MISPSYYSSEEWQAKRKKYLKKKCAWCGSKDNLTLHHKKPVATRYEIAKAMQRDKFNGDFEKEYNRRLKIEEQEYLNAKDDDFVTVCRKCHYIWEKHGKRLCPKCKKVYIKYAEQKRCADCYIEQHKEKKDERKKKAKRCVRKVRQHQKGQWDKEIKEIRKKMGEKPAPKGKRFKVTFGARNPDCKRKHMIIYASQIKFLTRILKKKNKIILDKRPVDVSCLVPRTYAKSLWRKELRRFILTQNCV